eukprot:6213816-Pleurochrysis_carterae.AAC.1
MRRSQLKLQSAVLGTMDAAARPCRVKLRTYPSARGEGGLYPAGITGRFTSLPRVGFCLFLLALAAAAPALRAGGEREDDDNCDNSPAGDHQEEGNLRLAPGYACPCA